MPLSVTPAPLLVPPRESSGDGDSSASSSSDETAAAPRGGAGRSRAAFVVGSHWRTASPTLRGDEAGDAGIAVLRQKLKDAGDGSGGAPVSSLVCPYDDDMHYEPGVCTAGWTSKELVESTDIYSRDFAELSMTIRVLSLALDPVTPLLDRLKFLCIVSSLLDEHFVQRLGAIEKTDPHDFRSSRLSLKRHIRPRTPHEDKLDRAIRAVVRDQHACLVAEVLLALTDYGVAVLEWAEMSGEERAGARRHFDRCVRSSLTPLVVDPTHPFPTLSSHVIYLCVMLRPSGSLVNGWGGGSAASAGASGSGSSGWGPGGGPTRRVFLKVPCGTRLVPVGDSGLRFLPMERLVRQFVGDVCLGMHVLSCHEFRVTRNVKMTLQDTDFVDRMDLMETVQGEIHRRRSAPPTRLEIPVDFPTDLRELLVAELALDDADVFVIDGPLLNLAGCMALAFVPLPELRAVQKDPQVPPRFRGIGDSLADDPGAIFRVIRDRDVLIEHPRDSFDASTLLFLSAAARDPRVKGIKQVIYRAGSSSPLIEALVRAAKNGKEVTVLVELKASFDEVQNCEYANTLQRAGCNVMYGLLGLKVHSKILLVVREEEDGSLETYCNISTGNFNAKTAKLYTDISIMTCNEDLNADMNDVFNSLTGYSRCTQFSAALVAPVNMMDRFSALVREEAANARAGRPGRIVAQVNGLSDVQIIRELYDASQAGVAIDLFVRGACRLRPGIPGLSENIRVFSWVGPVLQHRRIFYYYADGAEKYFIGSADWRTRNLNDRTEVAIPVFDERIKRRLGKMLTMLNDHRYLWKLEKDGRYYKISALSSPVSFQVQPVLRLTRLRLQPEDEEAIATELTARNLCNVAATSLGTPRGAVLGGPRGREARVGTILVSPHGGIGTGADSGGGGGDDDAGSSVSGPRFLGSPYGQPLGADESANSLQFIGLPASVGGHMVAMPPLTPAGSAVYAPGSLSAAGTAPTTPGAMNSLHSSRPSRRVRPRYKVSIKGNQMAVDKIAAGAVPVRFDDPADISTLQVMVVQRSDTDDPWSVPKGGINEGETPLDAAIRITREKGGVSRSEHIGTLGWVLRPKRNKTIAVSTFMLRVLDLGNFVNSLHDRRRQWMTFQEAIDLAVGSGNSFTTDSLRRAYDTCHEMFDNNAAALVKELADRPGSDVDRALSTQDGPAPGPVGSPYVTRRVAELEEAGVRTEAAATAAAATGTAANGAGDGGANSPAGAGDQGNASLGVEVAVDASAGAASAPVDQRPENAVEANRTPALSFPGSNGVESPLTSGSSRGE